MALILAGALYNQIARAASAPVPESAAAAFPVTALYDGRSDKPFMFSSAGGSGYVDFDLNQVTNGEFETAFASGLPGAGWSTDGATPSLTRSSAAPNAGTYHLAVSGGVAASGVFTLRVAAGETLTIEIHGRSTSGATPALAYVFDLETGLYVTPGGAWTATPTAFVDNATTAYTATTVTIAMPSQSTVLGEATLLRLKFFTGYWDSIAVYPRCDFVSVHGHGLTAAAGSIELRYGSTSPAATVATTLTLAQPTMWASFTVRSARYWRLFITTDPPDDATYISEMVLGSATTLTRAPDPGIEEMVLGAHDRADTSLGVVATYLRTQRDRRVARVRFHYPAAADYTQAREAIERARVGAYPLVFVADETDPAAAMLCVPKEQQWGAKRPWPVAREGGDMELHELPFPVVIA